MSSQPGVWLAILTVAVAIGIGFLVPVLFELRRSAQRLTSVLTITEQSLDPLLRDINATVKQLHQVTGDVSAVTDDVRVFSGSIRRVGANVGGLNSLVTIARLGLGGGLMAWKAGIGTGMSYLARHLFSKGGSS